MTHKRVIYKPPPENRKRPDKPSPGAPGIRLGLAIRNLHHSVNEFNEACRLCNEAFVKANMFNAKTVAGFYYWCWSLVR